MWLFAKYYEVSPYIWVLQQDYPMECRYRVAPTRSGVSTKMPSVAEDVVNSPKHYQVGGLECIDAIELLGLGFHVGNVFKYLWRAGRKDKTRTLEDMRKAAWYLARAINNLEKELNATNQK